MAETKRNIAELINAGYERIGPKGVICKCPLVKLGSDGYYWCCINRVHVVEEPVIAEEEDIRVVLQRAIKKHNKELTEEFLDGLGRQIGVALGLKPAAKYSRDYNFAIKYIVDKGYDWIIASVNGQIGGTPWAQVGNIKSMSATPLLALWLSYFRFEMGPEEPGLPLHEDIL